MIFNGNDYAPAEEKYTPEEIEEMKANEAEAEYERKKSEDETH